MQFDRKENTMIQAVISKIISLQSNFTVGENEIAQYVIYHADEVVTSTITAVAKKTNTSEASVNRFCKKVGFKGFNSFKVALAQENFYNQMNQQNMASAGESFIATVRRDYLQMLNNTSALLDEQTALQAAEAIKTAAHIFIFSFSNTALVAKEAEFKLNIAGLNATAVTDITYMHMQAANIGNSDLAIFIVPTVLMKDIYRTLNICRERGAKIMAITSYDSPKLSDLVHYKFITSDKITAQNSVSLSNNLMFLYVWDVIYAFLLEGDKRLRQKKLSNESLINNSQMLDNYLFEY